MQNVIKCGLVTRISAAQRTVRTHWGAGFVKATKIRVLPVLYAATKPKARSPMGFLLCGCKDWLLMMRRGRTRADPADALSPPRGAAQSGKPESSPAIINNQFITPQSGLANGLEWAALKKHRHLYTRGRAVRPFCQGLGKTEGKAVASPLFRVNDNLKGLWVDAGMQIPGEGRNQRDSTLARPMVKKV